MKTYLLALLISMITVYPPAYTIGVPNMGNNSGDVFKRWTWVRMFAELSCVLRYSSLFSSLTLMKFPESRGACPRLPSGRNFY